MNDAMITAESGSMILLTGFRIRELKNQASIEGRQVNPMMEMWR